MKPFTIPLKLNNVVFLESSYACDEVEPKPIGQFRLTQTLDLEFRDFCLSSGFCDFLVYLGRLDQLRPNDCNRDSNL
jgi:hypothetical protein